MRAKASTRLGLDSALGVNVNRVRVKRGLVARAQQSELASRSAQRESSLVYEISLERICSFRHSLRKPLLRSAIASHNRGQIMAKIEGNTGLDSSEEYDNDNDDISDIGFRNPQQCIARCYKIAI
jgi:hypothetical protein